ncbi:MAG: molecular chaperone HtpG [Lentisphaeria bacterium]|nr:molecular chaperone HtpG [Lentisphaeria bacterium]
MAEQHEFKTEVKQMLDLVIHSLYSNKEIFLREIISNASDAIDRARFESLKDPSVLEDSPEWKIKLIVDKDAKTLTVRDNGIGMTAAEVEKNIGTVANSGTKHFLENLKANKEELPPELIGQFGVGFYSAFMVADEVTLITRRAGDKSQGVKWISKGDGFYTLENVTKETRGTDVIIHLKDDETEFLEEWRLRNIVKKYSDFVEHPIAMDVEHQEPVKDADGKEVKDADGKPVPPVVSIVEETLNSQKAIWLRAKNDIKKEEYDEFYRHLSHDYQEPFETIHWSVEGQAEFKALVYIPQKPMWDMLVQENRPKGLQLYVHRVFITDTCEQLLPRYLRFLRGVVDSADLPLNVSREMLQEARALTIIRKNITKKVLDTLADMLKNAPERYDAFYTSFGAVLKEGLREDFENTEKIQNLMMFHSTTLEDGKRTTLADYVTRMPETQKEIYYLTAEDLVNAKNSPQLEAFQKKGFEVLFLTDPVDEFVIPSIESYKDKPLRDISKGDVDLDTEEEKKAKADERKAAEETNSALVAKLQELLKEKVSQVKLSNRLTDSACCLVDAEWAMSQQMQRMMKALKQEVPETKQILEINPAHPLIAALRDVLAKDAESPKLADYAKMLFDSARLMANLPIDDPRDFAKQIASLMADSLK